MDKQNGKMISQTRPPPHKPPVRMRKLQEKSHSKCSAFQHGEGEEEALLSERGVLGGSNKAGGKWCGKNQLFEK